MRLAFVGLLFCSCVGAQDPTEPADDTSYAGRCYTADCTPPTGGTRGSGGTSVGTGGTTPGSGGDPVGSGGSSDVGGSAGTASPASGGDTPGGSGATPSGGQASGTGGAPSGGAPGSGGEPSSGGEPASGGEPGSGGVTASGGAPSSGGATGTGGATGDPNCSRQTDPAMYCDPDSSTPYAWECDVLPLPGCVDEFGMYCCPDPCAPISLATHGWRCQNPSALQPWGCYEAYPGVSVPTGCEAASGTDVIICCPDGAAY